MLDQGNLTTPRRSRMSAVISDHAVARRDFLRRMVENDPAFDIVAETETGDECAAVIARDFPELAI
jgi:hypothetical protein